jgi:ketosteroid isomerase-like protein
MSRENVEVVRSLAEGFQRGQLERAFESFDPDIEWDASQVPGEVPGVAGVYRGHEGVRAFWREWLSAWRDLEFEIQGVRDAGDDVVLLIRDQHQWGRHGKVVRWRCFPDQESALEAMGLRE